MHIFWEKNALTRSDCIIQTLSWMGQVPDGNPPNAPDEGWKLDHSLYYQEGWLATGNNRGTVGVTFTTCHCKKEYDEPPRTNFNMRGHRTEVILVKWNEPYQKLATCDSTGVIFVWIKHEGRWSIELINDRNSQVTDFAWSHDGRMALICYRDGFVLVGSVAGQRYWSSLINLDGFIVTCGIWSPNDQMVLFGTSDGQVIAMSGTGTNITQVTLLESVEIVSMTWSCPKFNLEETDRNPLSLANNNILGIPLPINTHQASQQAEKDEGDNILAVSFKNGDIHLMSNYDDPCPVVIHTSLTGLKMEWCNAGEILAVGGFVRLPNLECRSEVRLYNREGQHRMSLQVPLQGKPISALTWGHNNRRLFVAVGYHIFTAWVSHKVASLELLCRHLVQEVLNDVCSVDELPLPSKLCENVSSMFAPTIKGLIPNPSKLREFVCIPPVGGQRLHCTMIKQVDDSPGDNFTLYLEYLGGLIPLLKGKRASKIRPEFEIYDPKIRSSNKMALKKDDEESIFQSSDSSECLSDSDVSQNGCASPRLPRKRRLLKRRTKLGRKLSTTSPQTLDELLYDDNLPEKHKLVAVTSNLWGTKFRVQGLASFLPVNIGQVFYKTSLLHLQPRQMTVTITDMTGDLHNHFYESCSFQDNDFSESEDEAAGSKLDFEEDIEPYVPVKPSESIMAKMVDMSTMTPIQQRRTQQMTSSTNACSNSIEAPVTIHVETSDEESDSSLPVLSSKQLLNGNSSTDRNALQTSVSCSSLTGKHVRDASAEKSTSHRSKRVGNCQCISANLGESEEDIEGEESSIFTLPASPRAVVQMAAKKLEDVFQSVYREGGSALVSSISMDKRKPEADKVKSREVTQSSLIEKGDIILQNHLLSEKSSLPATETQGNFLPSSQCNSCAQTQQSNHITPSKTRSQAIELNAQGSECNVCTHNANNADNGLIRNDSVKAESNLASSNNHVNAQSSSTMPSFHLPVVQSVGQSTVQSGLLSTVQPRHQSTYLPNATFRTNHRRHNSAQTVVQLPAPSRTSDQSSVPNSPILRHRRLIEVHDNSIDSRLTASQSVPSSPVLKKQKSLRPRQDLSSLAKTLLSPLTKRRQLMKSVDSSDEECIQSSEDLITGGNYRNLEMLQKAQLNKKLRRNLSESAEYGANISQYKTFVMHNKAPLWNENSQVYQLDFGGRVTQESAKNFQVEFQEKQVMQFGRIDNNAYTLDFQYPFSAVQAFSVALANVTQRLK